MPENKSESVELLPPKSAERQDVAAEAAPDPLAWLNAAERYAYDYLAARLRKGGAETYPLAPSVAESLYLLFRQGKTLHEIWDLNRKWSFGQVVHAAVEGHWALRRSTEAATAVPRAKERAVLAAAEGIELTADMMAALSRLHRDNIARFIQSGNPEDLGPALSSTTLAQLGKLAELLMKLTGQEQTKKVAVTGEVRHTGTITTVPTKPPEPIAQGTAAATLAALGAAERARIEAELKGG